MHITKRQIYYYDTDAEGVVYYGNYLRFLEEARTKMLEDEGFKLKELANKNILFAIKRQEIDYKAPIYYGEIIEIKTKIEEITSYRIRFYYEIFNSIGQKTTIARTDMVCINKNFNLNEIPTEIKEALKKYIL
ncbi:MAG: acyl-CoA thioesterase [Elusimicrobiales bacterium]|nr:acyl-CoA thioesterase [Elusimicrobiales bacterium]